MGKRGKALKRKRVEQSSSLLETQQSFSRCNADEDSEEDLADEEEQNDLLGGILETDLITCINVVKKLGAQLDLFRSRPFKALRVALHPIIVDQVRKYEVEAGKGTLLSELASSERPGSNRGRLAGLSPAERLKQMDRDALNARLLRSERLEKLEALNREGHDEEDGRTAALSKLRIPDGVAGMATIGNGTSLPLLKSQGEDEEVDDLTETCSSSSSTAKPMSLHNATQCYTCKAPFRELHFFYSNLCKRCADLNWSKREEKANMEGMVCIVTGARVKIGYRIALKLLRCGALVIATSRFVRDMARRYAAEQDAKEWGHRLHLYGLDFRNLRMLERWCAQVIQHYPRLDVIINNACQTIRRPPAYYSHLIALECMDMNHALKEPQFSYEKGCNTKIAARLLEGSEGKAGYLLGSSEFKSAPQLMDHRPEVARSEITKYANTPSTEEDDPIVPGMSLPDIDTVARTHCSEGLKNSISTLSQIPIIATDSMPEASSLDMIEKNASSSSLSSSPSSLLAEQQHISQISQVAFPVGKLDVNEQQVDTRRTNSWMLKLHEVSTGEAAEVLAINTLAPFIINGRLRALMERSGPVDENCDSEEALKFIVNVSAMEGKFYRFKTSQHPHTNMAKAALNMMTRTSADEYMKTSGIYMTAVDTVSTFRDSFLFCLWFIPIFDSVMFIHEIPEVFHEVPNTR